MHASSRSTNVRNPGIATVLCPAGCLWLDAATQTTLFEPRFLIDPDSSHTYEYNEATIGADATSTAGFDAISTLETAPRAVSPFWGDERGPFPPTRSGVHAGDARRRRRCERASGVERRRRRYLVDFVLPGDDVLVIDNRRLVHGRRPFVASYDGSDCWLKRVSLTTDLTTTMRRRDDASSRTIT